MGVIFIVLAVMGVLAIVFTIPITARTTGRERHVQWFGRLLLACALLFKLANYLQTGLLAISNLPFAAGVALVYGAQLLREHRRRQEEGL